MSTDDAPSSTRELDALLDTLGSLRVSALSKLTGLTDADARRSTVPSGTCLAGLIQHLTFVESKWFEENVAGGRARRGKRSMDVDPALSLAVLRRNYRDAWVASDAIARALGDPATPIPGNGRSRDLRWAILSVTTETARHAGHADIIREQINAATDR